MIPVPTGVRVWLATGHTDMRKGFGGLSLLVQETLQPNRHLCVVGDYVAAEEPATVFRHFAALRRHIIRGSQAVGVPRPLP
ncbi:IS66 family insertion sequence element accessory protein TnpB [Microvirga calopogonii]|uniref:IS66 family insertion sequence element accessory protein TnpB n=1 Tax=Microvirga calopogonii TaxID=2078013 RepID=UPI000E0CE141|nr:IS66 family insertion sequence element accessory protein TnpB [Microvirga calopogonii]